MSDSSLQRAVVLAAGRGTRMGEITATVPKPMLLVQERPILEHILDRMAQAGVREFLIVVGYRREAIEQYFRNWRLPVSFRLQEPVNGTGSAARLAREFAGDAPFLLTFGDILCDAAAYSACAAVLRDHPQTKAVLGVKYVDDPARGAAVYEEEGKVVRVVEKPAAGTSTTHWGSAGLYAFTPEVFPYLDRLRPTERNEYELTSIFGEMIADGLEVRLSPIEGTWRDVGRPEDLRAANAKP